MSRPAVLFVDNKIKFLETRSEFLRVAGFQVHLATTMADAEQIARDHFIQVAVIDLRLLRDNDDTDVSGFALAQRPFLKNIHRIILTIDGMQGHAIEALRTNRPGGPIAHDYITKDEGPEALIEAINKLLGRDGDAKPPLYFYWGENNEPLSFEELVCKIDPNIRENRERLPDQCHELEDLFRKAFADYTQVTVTRVYWQKPGRVVLGIIAFSHHRSGAFLMHCGLIDKIRQEKEQHDLYLKDSPRTAASTGALVGVPFEHQRFGVMLYDPMTADIEQVQTFKEFFEQHGDEAVLKALHNLFKVSLPSWHEQYPGAQDQENLAQVYRKQLDLDHEKMPQPHFRQYLHALLKECHARFGIEVSFVVGKMLVQFPGQETESYPNPIKYLYDTDFWSKIDFQRQTTPINLDVETILVDAATHKTLLSDFAQVNRMPLGYQYAYFETQMRFLPMDFAKIPALLEADANLLEEDAQGALFNPQESISLTPQSRRFKIVAETHALARALPGLDPLVYAAGLFFCTLAAFSGYDQDIRLTNNAIRGLLYRLLFAGALCRLFEQRKNEETRANDSTRSLRPVLRVDAVNREVWVDDQQVILNRSEFDLLAYLYERRGKLCLTEDLMADVYRLPKYTTNDVNNQLSNYVSRVRSKIEPDPRNPVFLFTVPKSGYKLIA